MEEKKITLEKQLKGIRRNISLAEYTTFKIGGKAKYFFIAKAKKELIKAIRVAKKFHLPFFILGGGSNILVSDKGFDGMVIKVQGSRFKVQGATITTEAGVLLGKIVNASARAGFVGLEWAAGIPGTVGGAIYGNAGAFGKSMKDVIESVEVLDVEKINPPKFCEAKLRRVKKRDCKFGYRDSIFKKNKNQSTKLCFVLGRAHKIMCSDLIILSTKFRLKKGNKKEIKNKIRDYLNFRRKTQPLNFPSAGSIFKNPLGFSAGELVEEDKSSSPRLAAVRLIEEDKSSSLSLTAARLIEKCGLKGKRIGKAQISKKHANFIINLGGATSKEVKKLINLAKKKVKKKFKINLEEEICYLGF